MKKLSYIFLSLILLLSACLNNGVATESPATQNPAPTNAVITETPAPTKSIVTETTVPAREAVISDTKNDVLARALLSDDFSSATIGMSIHPSGGVETGTDSRVRLDLRTEGTIVRVGPNSSFILSEITERNGQPKTTIELFFGKIFILLNGGSLDVKTSTGVASVRGSLMRVEYDLEKKLFMASCLEGNCTLKNRNGEIVELIGGEFSYIENGQPPVNPERIYREEIQEWLVEVPELAYFLPELPNPKDYPQHNPVAIPTPTKKPRDDNAYPNP